MHRVDPRWTCILSICVDPIYPVYYRSLSCQLSLRSMSSRVKVMHGTCCCTIWHWGHETPSSFVKNSNCIRNDSESVNAFLSASLVSFERWSSSCRVIQAGILANCANMSKWKGVLSPLGGFFLQGFIKENLFLLFFVLRHWGLDRYNSSQRRWWLCPVGYLVVLSQVLLTKTCAHWLRDSRLCS